MICESAYSTVEYQQNYCISEYALKQYGTLAIMPKL